jgi:hypothetical protein
MLMLYIAATVLSSPSAQRDAACLCANDSFADVQIVKESFGIFSVQGIAAWTVAGAAAYLYIILPSQKAEKEAMVRR